MRARPRPRNWGWPRRAPKAEHDVVVLGLIKDSRLKLSASIQGDAVRVAGAKKDDLQAAIQLVRKSVTDLPLQFINFRD